ncbi:MAG: peptidase G2 autoproteolytic cleavage domain-containing protein [Halanaerobium sp.]|nr:peptidase G2 autoproteolytic cleavage domain-containing protein [Halanaerobium sp.]
MSINIYRLMHSIHKLIRKLPLNNCQIDNLLFLINQAMDCVKADDFQCALDKTNLLLAAVERLQRRNSRCRKNPEIKRLLMLITKLLGILEGEVECNAQVVGECASAEGCNTSAIGDCSHSEGSQTTATGKAAHAEGCGTKASGNCSHAEGLNTEASALNGGSHAEGTNTKASGLFSHAEGSFNESSGNSAHAEGCYNNSTNDCAHAEGCYTTASGDCSHSEGQSTIAEGTAAHAEGRSTKASGVAAHAEGYETEALLDLSHAEGNNTVAGALGSHIMGEHGMTCEMFAWHMAGGSSTSQQVTAIIRNNGNACFQSVNSCPSCAADFAEMFETVDGKEIAVGYFVTLEGEKIRKASSNDDYILGVTSSTPAVLAGTAELCWKDKYLKDEWGRFQYEKVTVPAKKDENGNIILAGYEKMQKIINPDYDEKMQYVSRTKRPEWVPVGMLGKILVRDDGSCRVNGYCRPNDDGVATNSDSGYRVIKRSGEMQILIIL